MCNVVVVSSEALSAIVEAAVRRALAERTSHEPSDWVDAGGAATLLGINRRTVANLAQRGALPRARIGRLLRFRRADVLALLETR